MKQMEAESWQLMEQSKTNRLQLEELHFQQQEQPLAERDAFLAKKAARFEQWEEKLKKQLGLKESQDLQAEPDSGM